MRVILASLLLFVAPHAGAVTWTANGPGSVTLNDRGDTVILTYDLDVSRTYGTFEWELTGHGFRPGEWRFNWSYDGSHDVPQAATSLRAPDHWLVNPGDGSGAFSYSGQNLLIENDRTDNFRFLMTATSDDVSQNLTGSLVLTMVPVPPAIAMMLLGIAGLAGAARLRRRS